MEPTKGEGSRVLRVESCTGGWLATLDGEPLGNSALESTRLAAVLALYQHSARKWGDPATYVFNFRTAQEGLDRTPSGRGRPVWPSKSYLRTAGALRSTLAAKQLTESLTAIETPIGAWAPFRLRGVVSIDVEHAQVLCATLTGAGARTTTPGALIDPREVPQPRCWVRTSTTDRALEALGAKGRVVIVGPEGAGKTELALQIGREWPQGARYLDLGSDQAGGLPSPGELTGDPGSLVIIRLRPDCPSERTRRLAKVVEREHQSPYLIVGRERCFSGVELLEPHIIRHDGLSDQETRTLISLLLDELNEVSPHIRAAVAELPEIPPSIRRPIHAQRFVQFVFLAIARPNPPSAESIVEGALVGAMQDSNAALAGDLALLREDERRSLAVLTIFGDRETAARAVGDDDPSRLDEFVRSHRHLFASAPRTLRLHDVYRDAATVAPCMKESLKEFAHGHHAELLAAIDWAPGIARRLWYPFIESARLDVADLYEALCRHIDPPGHRVAVQEEHVALWPPLELALGTWHALFQQEGRAFARYEFARLTERLLERGRLRTALLVWSVVAIDSYAPEEAITRTNMETTFHIIREVYFAHVRACLPRNATAGRLMELRSGPSVVTAPVAFARGRPMYLGLPVLAENPGEPARVEREPPPPFQHDGAGAVLLASGNAETADAERCLDEVVGGIARRVRRRVLIDASQRFSKWYARLACAIAVPGAAESWCVERRTGTIFTFRITSQVATRRDVAVHFETRPVDAAAPVEIDGFAQGPRAAEARNIGQGTAGTWRFKRGSGQDALVVPVVLPSH